MFSIHFRTGDNDLKLAKTPLEELLRSYERIHADPASFVPFQSRPTAASALSAAPWVDTPDCWNVHFDTIEKVKHTFDDKGISIPYSQMDVHLGKEAPAAA